MKRLLPILVLAAAACTEKQPPAPSPLDAASDREELVGLRRERERADTEIKNLTAQVNALKARPKTVCPTVQKTLPKTPVNKQPGHSRGEAPKEAPATQKEADEALKNEMTGGSGGK